MNIVMIGKNDTWGAMMMWKQLLPDNIKYFMAHPAIPYQDLSEYNKYLKQSLEEADAIISCIAIRNRGVFEPLIIHSNNLEKYKDKTIIYLGGDREVIYKAHEYKNLLKNYRGYVALTPDIATILNISYLPQPVLFDKLENKYDIEILKKEFIIISYPTSSSQQESSLQDIEDYKALGLYFAQKYKKRTKFIVDSILWEKLHSVFKESSAQILYDNKEDCFSNLAFASASQGIATISSLKAEYRAKFQEVFPTKSLPFINVTNLAELKYMIDILLQNPEFIIDEGNRASRWMETFWNRDRHIKNLNKVLKTFNFRGKIR